MTSFQNLHQPTKRELLIEDKSYLFFGGTAYLGLLDNPDYISLYKKGIDLYGLNNGTSRSNNVQLGIYEEGEENIATRFGFEAAALFSSGYLAAQTAVKALVGSKEIIYAPGSHPALWLDETVSLGDFDTWVIETIAYINNSENADFVIISNCIDNLKPANFDFSPFTAITTDKKVLFILDDSHGLGVLNRNRVSSDLSALNAKSNFEVVIVSSLAKGLGTDAGVVLGTEDSIQEVKKHPIFMGASPAAPAAIYALVNGDDIYNVVFDRLHHNIAYFDSLLPSDHDLSHIPQFSVYSSLEPDLYGYLSHNNILISSFPYPLKTSPLLNRIVISALHTEADLDYLAKIYLSKIK